MKVTLSHHSIKSFKDHLPCRPDKMAKVAHKAWLSEEPIPRRRNQKVKEAQEQGSELRLFLGQLWVFKKAGNDCMLLVTLYPLKRECSINYQLR
jgi:hypothetical protein